MVIQILHNHMADLEVPRVRSPLTICFVQALYLVFQNLILQKAMEHQVVVYCSAAGGQRPVLCLNIQAEAPRLTSAPPPLPTFCQPYFSILTAPAHGRPLTGTATRPCPGPPGAATSRPPARPPRHPPLGYYDY